MKYFSALTLTGFLVATPALAQERAEVTLVKQIFAQIQPLSFKNDREYCGYLARKPDGTLTATPAKKGQRDSCEPRAPKDDDWLIVASYHTHGAFDMDVPAEFPSVTDIEADEDEGIDGYVATPGGRLWYVDTTEMAVGQICGIGCLEQDPNFEAGLDGTIAQSYTYRQLLDIEAE